MTSLRPHRLLHIRLTLGAEIRTLEPRTIGIIRTVLEGIAHHTRIIREVDGRRVRHVLDADTPGCLGRPKRVHVAPLRVGVVHRDVEDLPVYVPAAHLVVVGDVELVGWSRGGGDCAHGAGLRG